MPVQVLAAIALRPPLDSLGTPNESSNPSTAVLCHTSATRRRSAFTDQKLICIHPVCGELGQSQINPGHVR